jgi:hypothetical protein
MQKITNQNVDFRNTIQMNKITKAPYRISNFVRCLFCFLNVFSIVCYRSTFNSNRSMLNKEMYTLAICDRKIYRRNER